jgi:hypothetical protein
MRRKYKKTIEKELCKELDGCGVGKLEYKKKEKIETAKIKGL